MQYIIEATETRDPKYKYLKKPEWREVKWYETEEEAKKDARLMRSRAGNMETYRVVKVVG